MEGRGARGGWKFRTWAALGTKVAVLLCVLQPGQRSRRPEGCHYNAGNRAWEGSGKDPVLSVCCWHTVESALAGSFRADFDCALQACPVLQTYGVEPAGDGESDEECPKNVLIDPKRDELPQGILLLLASPYAIFSSTLFLYFTLAFFMARCTSLFTSFFQIGASGEISFLFVENFFEFFGYPVCNVCR